MPAVAAADIDGDGRVDLLYGNRGRPNVLLFGVWRLHRNGHRPCARTRRLDVRPVPLACERGLLLHVPRWHPSSPRYMSVVCH